MDTLYISINECRPNGDAHFDFIMGETNIYLDSSFQNNAFTNSIN